MPQRDLYLAAYDIAHDRRRSAALALVRGYTTGGQKSVHEIFLTQGERQELLHTLALLLNEAEARRPRGRARSAARLLSPPRLRPRIARLRSHRAPAPGRGWLDMAAVQHCSTAPRAFHHRQGRLPARQGRARPLLCRLGKIRALAATLAAPPLRPTGRPVARGRRALAGRSRGRGGFLSMAHPARRPAPTTLHPRKPLYILRHILLRH